ncbi:hypothetical protein VZT92_005498 [Zoarces viviparus]|uniref:CARD domain-containing protein n=1 Tax=Zoarces viviparus TaxID=48416 RepID=A0AAW1FUA0_ZOAVI
MEFLYEKSNFTKIKDKMNSKQEQGWSPTVYADSNSVVLAKEMTNVKAKNLNCNIETGSDPGSSQTVNAVRQVPQADYTACGGSVIWADKISGVTLDGDLNISVNTSRAGAGTAAATLPSSQEPAVKMIVEHKVELIDCLKADHAFILQHAHAKHIVTQRQYWNLKDISPPEKNVTNLIDEVIVNGQESCSLFLQVLKEPEFLQTYPQLIEITKQCC